MDNRRVVGAFESLGGGKGSRQNNGRGGGCEFGILQNNFGAEPLGLLRWATIELDCLIRGVRAGFEGLGDDDTLELHPQGHPDWQIKDRAYGIQIDHTNLFRDRITAEQAKPQVQRNLAFLRRKFLEDLRSGEKIFVYRLADDHCPHERIQALADAIGSYGGGRLLFVLQDENIGDGIVKIGDGFILNSSSRNLLAVTMKPRGLIDTPINYATWLDICRMAVGVWPPRG
jgi:hypothetical protein